MNNSPLPPDREALEAALEKGFTDRDLKSGNTPGRQVEGARLCLAKRSELKK